MNTLVLGLGAAAIGIYALLSRLLNRNGVSGPMYFTAVGILAVSIGLGEPPTGDVIGVGRVSLQMTLALVLFTDAMATNVKSWRDEGKLPGRLLTLGMLVTIMIGAMIAAPLFSELDLVGAAILATILAATDSSVAKRAVSNERVPDRIRAALNIESGLNDGTALPLLLFFIALAEAEEGANLFSLAFSSIGLAVVGIAVGWVFARAVIFSSDRGWMLPIWRQIFVVTVPVAAFVAADEIGGSGFISTFVAGLTFGRLVLPSYPDIAEFAEDLAQVLTMVAFMIFGGLILQPRFGDFTWEMVLYALLSLTVIRLVPVAISMIGVHLRPPSILYLGWFGPRGLASLVVAAVVIEDADVQGTDLIATVVALTVALSILLHGLSANPGSTAYANWFKREKEEDEDMRETEPVESTQERRRISDM